MEENKAIAESNGKLMSGNQHSSSFMKTQQRVKRVQKGSQAKNLHAENSRGPQDGALSV